MIHPYELLERVRVIASAEIALRQIREQVITQLSVMCALHACVGCTAAYHAFYLGIIEHPRPRVCRVRFGYRLPTNPEIELWSPDHAGNAVVPRAELTCEVLTKSITRGVKTVPFERLEGLTSARAFKGILWGSALGLNVGDEALIAFLAQNMGPMCKLLLSAHPEVGALAKVRAGDLASVPALKRLCEP